MNHIDIQSIADIITNSSSEVFVVEAQGMSKCDVEKMIEDSIREIEESGGHVHFSGMGHDLTVYDNESSKYQYLPENHFAIDMDRGMYKTAASKLSEKVKIVDAFETSLAIDASTGEIKGLWSAFYEDPGNFKCPGGKWIAKKKIEFDKSLLKSAKQDVEDLANKAEGGHSFLKKVQDAMNLVDKIQRDMAYMKNVIAYSEKMFKIEKERWKKRNK